MNDGKKQENPIRHPIRFKIFLVSLAPTLALFAAALLNNQYLNDLGDSAEKILSQNYKSIRAAQEGRKMIEGIRNLLFEQLSGKRIDRVVSQEMLTKLAASLTICRDNITEIGEKELINHLLERFACYRLLSNSLNEAGDETWGNDRYTDFLARSSEMISLIDDLVVLNESAMERAEQQTRMLAQQAQRNAIALFGVIITAILALSYFLSYRIARPVMTLARHLSATQEGSGVYPTVYAETDDEIGFLTNAFNHLFSRLQEYDRHRDDILSAEKEKVRQAEEAKGRFIADISHQLKTPMTSLGMSIGMLHSRGNRLDSDKKKKLVATAHDDCNRLAALINELVDLSRLEAMSKPRIKETLDIAEVVLECLAPLTKQAENTGVSIHIDIPADLPRVTIDSFRFPWVLTNLVGNALRYTNHGGSISLKIEKQGSRFYFHCTDTGSGINPEYLPHIFDRFTQFSERGKSGTIGLGLAIVKDIIEQHGGDIQVQSKPGEGASFTFWIPAAQGDRV